MDLARLMMHPHRMAKGKNGFVKSLVITNHVVDIAYKTTMKKQVSRSKRLPTCHHCRVKGHTRPHYSKL